LLIGRNVPREGHVRRGKKGGLRTILYHLSQPLYPRLLKKRTNYVPQNRDNDERLQLIQEQ